MEFLMEFLDFVLNLDQSLTAMVKEYGGWIYFLLFAVVFCETGLVVAPFLPGIITLIRERKMKITEDRI